MEQTKPLEHSKLDPGSSAAHVTGDWQAVTQLLEIIFAKKKFRSFLSYKVELRLSIKPFSESFNRNRVSLWKY